MFPKRQRAALRAVLGIACVLLVATTVRGESALTEEWTVDLSDYRPLEIQLTDEGNFALSTLRGPGVRVVDLNGMTIWETILAWNSGPNSLSILPDGDVAVAGPACGWVHEVTPPREGCFNTIVARLAADGSVSWVRSLSGSGQDSVNACLSDSSGNIYVAGGTESATDFPVKGPHAVPWRAYLTDGFLAKFSPAGELLWVTCLANYGEGELHDVTLMADGTVVVAGVMGLRYVASSGSSFEALSGAGDPYVAWFSPEGELLGETSIAGELYDVAHRVGADASGNVYIAGSGRTRDFPVPDAWHSSHRGDIDGFVVKLNARYEPLWSSHFGGRREDRIRAMEVDAEGNIYLHGFTASSDFPLINALPYTSDTWRRPFITGLTSEGHPEWSTYFSNYNTGSGIVFKDDMVYVSGAGRVGGYVSALKKGPPPTITPTPTPTSTSTPNPTPTPTADIHATNLVVNQPIVLSGTHSYHTIHVGPQGVIQSDGRRLALYCYEFIHEGFLDASALAHYGPGTGLAAEDAGAGGGGGVYGGTGGEFYPEAYGTENGFTIQPGSPGGDGSGCPWIYYKTDPIPRIYCDGCGGHGGGAILIQAHRARIASLIRADGEQGTSGSIYVHDCRGNYSNGSGGSGSGGGILVMAGDLEITATARLHAKGADLLGGRPFFLFEDPSGHPGSGGRIKIYYETGRIDPAADISASGGDIGNSIVDPGPDGTVWIEQLAPGTLFPSPDLNGDGVIDREDLLLFREEWGDAAGE